MAFPTIPTTASGDLLSATTSPASTTHTFPSLSSLRGGAGPQAGDLLIAICVQYQGGTAGAEFGSWGASFTETSDDALASGTGNEAIGVAHKIATGSESGTFTVTSVHSFKSVNFLMRIPAGTWHGTTIPEVQAATRAAGAVANPGSFDPTNWAVEDTLWIAVAGHSETSTTGSPPTLDTPPTNYTGQLIVARVADAVGDITAGVAFRQLNASSEDVGTWAASNATRGNGIAAVIAVRPVIVITETPTPGGALAGGNAATIAAALVLAGAIAAGIDPVALAGGPAISGAIAQGVDVAGVQASVVPGGAVAGGVPPLAPVFEMPPPGGALAAGVDPAAAISIIASGALASGAEPGPYASPAAGGALASGSAPTPLVDVAAGSALADGAAAPALVPVSIAGALAGGFSPSEQIGGGGTTETPVPGGALADGVSPLAFVAADVSGAAAGGISPDALALLAAEGALAGGFSPVGANPVVPGGALGAGLGPDAIVILASGGAIGGGRSPRQLGAEIAAFLALVMPWAEVDLDVALATPAALDLSEESAAVVDLSEESAAVVDLSEESAAVVV